MTHSKCNNGSILNLITEQKGMNRGSKEKIHLSYCNSINVSILINVLRLSKGVINSGEPGQRGFSQFCYPASGFQSAIIRGETEAV